MECPLKDRTCTHLCVRKNVVWPFFVVYNMYTNILTNTVGENRKKQLKTEKQLFHLLSDL